MKRITDFIIDKRYPILFVFIIFTIVSAIVSNKVNINYDMAKYLPDDSKTRIGINIMEKEFSKTQTSNLNLMFIDLNDDEKIPIKEYLEDIDGVSSVSYDNSKDYNRGKYTLYVLSIDGKSDSTTGTKVYNKIINKYDNYKLYTSGDISETNESVLPITIIVLAVVCALIILLIMCESFTEPFLFLITILMAVVLNKGTNIFFNSVSNITNSIVAILQMALSMDYSIMLMNRYDQEKKTQKDKVVAMKKALHKAFQSISSSSVTTIVGLLALVFMSFKIGKDLGFILAKGVLLSLICIFFVLPSLILMFDKLIIKTKKKSPNIKLDKLGKISYKLRYISVPLFILVFIASFLLKGNLKIDYTDRLSDEISKVFKENNQIALIYQNKDEDKIAKYLNVLEKNKHIDEVLGYSNTINQKLTYSDLKNKLKDLSSDVSIEDYLLKIVYYNYYNKEDNTKLSFEEFINFIEEDAYNNPKINDKIDDNIKDDINRLKNFTSEEQINKKRTKSEISSILGIDEDKISDLFIYYNSLYNNTSLTLNEFVNFMNKDVLPNEKFSSKISQDNRNKLNMLSNFININNIKRNMTKEELSKIFSLDVNTVDDILKYYILTSNTDYKMTLNSFTNFVINDIYKNNEYSSSISKEDIDNLNLLQVFSNKEIINRKLDSTSLANLFNLDKTKVDQLLLLKYLNSENNSEYSIKDFINYVLYIKKNTNYLTTFDTTTLEQLKNDPKILNDDTKYSSIEMSTLLQIDITQIYKIYNLIDYVTGNMTSYTITPLEFVNLILDNSDNAMIKESIDNATFEKLNLLKQVMTASITDTNFTYQELSKLIGIQESVVKSIYSLYISNYSNITLSPLEFVNFLLNHKNDEMLSNRLSLDTINELNVVKKVMDGTLNNTKYNYDSLSNLLNIDKDNVKLLYGLYYSLYINNNRMISLNEFINFVLDDVITNEEYNSNFDTEKTSRLKTINTIMKNSLNNTKYTKDQIYIIISGLSSDVEKNMLDLLYIYYGSNNLYEDTWKMTIEEFVNYLNNVILKDKKFTDFIDTDMKKQIVDSKKTIKDNKKLLIGKKYSRVVLNTKLDLEGKTTFDVIENIQNDLKNINNLYVVGNSPMAYEMSKTFNSELNFITILTMILIFIVVAITFKSIIIPIILVTVIQCAVYLIMGILSVTGDNVYFISLLIVQSILMGATIDYAILYTSYYLENRKLFSIKESIIESYNKSFKTILISSSILIIVTLIIACFASAIAAKICKTISQGTICSTILILVLLPAMLATCDKLIVKKDREK